MTGDQAAPDRAFFTVFLFSDYSLVLAVFVERSLTMKRITLLAAAFAILPFSPVFAQTPEAKPAPAPAMKAAKEAAQPAPPKLAQATGRRTRAMEDARSCLQHATNSEIAKCAEQYR